METKEVKCVICEHPLILDDEDKDDGYASYHCDNCGCIIETAEADNEDEEYPKNITVDFHGYEGKCPKCGNYLTITGNFMRSEIIGDIDESVTDEYGLYEDDTVTDSCFCQNCGTYVSIIPPKPSEEKNYPFYNQD